MISIIILTYNSEKYIEKLLNSLIQNNKNSIEDEGMEIIVADNKSSDNTVSLVKKFAKHVSLVNNGGNLGFAKGNNKAVEKARGDYIVFLNPDAEFTTGDISKMVSHLDEPGIGVVGGKILKLDGSKELSCGKFYNYLNIALLCLGLEEKCGVRFSPKQSEFVDHVSGGFMGIRKDVFIDNGGFDEHYFMYVEDQDLCFRLRKKGLKSFYSTGAQIKHIGQGSSNREFAVVNIYKGLSYFQKRHMNRVSYHLSVNTLKLKALMLVSLGTVTHNNYLKSTYGKALHSI